jgi:chaperonin GroEL
MIREVHFGKTVREKLQKGVDIVAEAVKVTLGPKGRNVIIDKNYVTPHITKDGVTVAKSITLEDRFENMGASMLQDVAKKALESSGDGTSTAIVLAQAILNKSMSFRESGENPIQLNNEIFEAKEFLKEELKKVARKIESKEDLYSVALISANGDEEIAKLISDVYHEVGQAGSITIDNSPSESSWYEMQEGTNIDQGYVSAYFAEDQGKQIVSFEDCYVLITADKFETLEQVKFIMPFLQEIHKKNKPLLFIADEFDHVGLQTLIANKINQGLKVVCVKAPSVATLREEMLKDLATLTGAHVMNSKEGTSLDKLKAEHVGTAGKVVVTRDSTTIVKGGGDPSEIEERINVIKENIANMGKDKWGQKRYLDRIAMLEGKVARIFIGAYTEVELKEKKDRVDDALQATKAALEEGIIEGGGYTLMKIRESLDRSSNGSKILYNACAEPFNNILKNGGYSPEAIFREDQGFDARTGVHCNLFESGIIDPMKVTRVALESACSIAGLLMTTECAIVNHHNENDLAALQRGRNMNGNEFE